MNEALQQMQKSIERLTRSIRKVRARQLYLQKIKEEARSLVSRYFSDFRTAYLASGGKEDYIAKADSSFQNLLRCTHRDTLTSTYLHVLKEASKSLHELELITLSPAAQVSDVTRGDIRHRRIIETLNKINSSAGSSYEQALEDLMYYGRKSWRGTAVEFREALREILDALAPDEDVLAQPGFKLEPDAKGPTMKQKAVFILKARRRQSDQIRTSTDAIEIVEELVGKYVRSVYVRSSVGTHTHVSRDEVCKIRDYIALALVELLEIKV